MRTVVQVNLPANASTQDQQLFDTQTSYEITPLRIKSLKNVFITHEGICLQKGKIVPESIHGYPDKLPHFYQDSLLKLRKAYHANPPAIVSLNDHQTYFLIHHPWFNYYHWITESLQRLELVHEQFNGHLAELVLLLPESYQHMPYVQESLEPFAFKNILYIPRSYAVHARRILLPQIKPICSSYYPEISQKLRAFYLDYVLKKKKPALEPGLRIYLSRAHSHRRRIANEAEVRAVVNRYGFIVIETEAASFFEQVSLFSSTQYFVSIHGAGLTNIQFMKAGTSVLELHKKQTNPSDHHSLVYWNLASVLDIHYHHQVCEPVDPSADFYTADLTVDVPLLEHHLKQMIGSI